MTQDIPRYQVTQWHQLRPEQRVCEFLGSRYPGTDPRWHARVNGMVRFTVGPKYIDVSTDSLGMGVGAGLCTLLAKHFDAALAKPKPQRTPFRPGRKRVRFAASVPHATVQQFNSAGVWVPVRRPGAWSGT